MELQNGGLLSGLEEHAEDKQFNEEFILGFTGGEVTGRPQNDTYVFTFSVNLSDDDDEEDREVHGAVAEDLLEDAVREAATELAETDNLEFVDSDPGEYVLRTPLTEKLEGEGQFVVRSDGVRFESDDASLYQGSTLNEDELYNEVVDSMENPSEVYQEIAIRHPELVADLAEVVDLDVSEDSEQAYVQRRPEPVIGPEDGVKTRKVLSYLEAREDVQVQDASHQGRIEFEDESYRLENLIKSAELVSDEETGYMEDQTGQQMPEITL